MVLAMFSNAFLTHTILTILLVPSKCHFLLLLHFVISGFLHLESLCIFLQLPFFVLIILKLSAQAPYLRIFCILFPPWSSLTGLFYVLFSVLSYHPLHSWNTAFNMLIVNSLMSSYSHEIMFHSRQYSQHNTVAGT